MGRFDCTWSEMIKAVSSECIGQFKLISRVKQSLVAYFIFQPWYIQMLYSIASYSQVTSKLFPLDMLFHMPNLESR